MRPGEDGRNAGASVGIQLRMPAIVLVLAAVLLGQPAVAQPVDVARLGPQPGTAVPAFSAPDQDGRVHTLASILGSNGALLVFSRSADW